MKKLINVPGEEVREMLEGLALAVPDLVRLDRCGIISTGDIRNPRIK